MPSAAPQSATSFLREFIRNPRATAAVAPSSRALARRMVETLDPVRVRTVLEYGPGSGVFTRAVIDRLPAGWLASEGGQGRFIAIEFNPRLGDLVRAAHHRVDVAVDSAENVERVCAERGVRPGEVDAIISGLGWASLPPTLTTSILEATLRVLRPGGELHTFAYHVGQAMPGARHFRSEVRRLFARVTTRRGAWLNLPPAFIFTCSKGAGGPVR